MPFTHTYGLTMVSNAGGLPLGGSATATGDQEISMDVPLVGEVANAQIQLALTLSRVKGAFLVADRDVNVFVNAASTGSPAHTINLLANTPQAFWGVGDNVFGASNVTALYATNTSESDATLKIRVVYDPTP